MIGLIFALIFYMICPLNGDRLPPPATGCGYPPYRGYPVCRIPDSALPKNSYPFYLSVGDFEGIYYVARENKTGNDGEIRGNHCRLYTYKDCSDIVLVALKVVNSQQAIRIRTFIYNYATRTYSWVEYYLAVCPGPFLCGQGTCETQGIYDNGANCQAYIQPTNTPNEERACGDTICLENLSDIYLRFCNSRGECYSGPSAYQCYQNQTLCAQAIPVGYDSNNLVQFAVQEVLPANLEFLKTCKLYHKG